MSPLALTVNGRTLEDHPQSVIFHQGVYYGAVREIFKVLGGHTTWLSREGQAVVRWANHLVVIPENGSVITLNGERKVMEQRSRLVGGHLYVPLESFAKTFSGCLLEEQEMLRLFLPMGHLVSVTIAGEALHLGWTAEGEVDADLRGGKLVMSLTGTTWPIPLRKIQIERQPGGWIDVLVETSGGQLSHTTGDRGIRVEWQESQGETLAGLTFAIDAGHGGSDPGASGPAGALEKDITRSIADKLMAELLAAGAGVVDVRPKDQRVSREERMKSARKGGADILVSIHLNGHNRASSGGSETFHFPGNHKGAVLADRVQDALSRHLKLHNRGVKQASFYLLKAFPDIPAILTEVGSLCDPAEERFLTDGANQGAVAAAIFFGLQQFIEEQKSYIVS